MDNIDDKNKNELQRKTDNFNEYIDQISVLLKSVSKVMEDFTNEFSRNVVPALKYLSKLNIA